jgi:hypothetical protein
MDAREAGRRAARRWTGLLSALGIGLTGILGFGTYHLIEDGKSTISSTGAKGTGSGSSEDDAGGSDDSSGSRQGGLGQAGSSGSNQGGFGAGSGPGQTGSSGS